MKYRIVTIMTLMIAQPSPAQVKQTESFQQIWTGIFNQTRFSEKFGLWADIQVRTQDNFADKFYQSIARAGIIFYMNENCKIIAGYAKMFHYPGDNHKFITQPENRLWQMFQWQTKYPKSRIVQGIRLEERYRKKILNDSALGDGYGFNFRARYNFWYDISLSKKGIVPHSWSVLFNDEIMVNFGKQVVYNYFDQNRFFIGLKYQLSGSNNIQAGYLNLFQQSSAGNKYKSIHAARILYYHYFDFRKSKKA